MTARTASAMDASILVVISFGTRDESNVYLVSRSVGCCTAYVACFENDWYYISTVEPTEDISTVDLGSRGSLGVSLTNT